MNIKFEKMTDEQINELLASIQKEDSMREVRRKLPEHEELKKFHKAINKAVDELGVDADEIRLAEMFTYIEDFPGFVVKVNNKLEEWKSEHATYRDPHDPKNYWYSPDGGGNPPKWVRETAGEKPKKEKNPNYKKALVAWLEKLEPYRVQKEEQRKAA